MRANRISFRAIIIPVRFKPKMFFLSQARAWWGATAPQQTIQFDMA
jgi:hypothetical protein